MSAGAIAPPTAGPSAAAGRGSRSDPSPSTAHVAGIVAAALTAAALLTAVVVRLALAGQARRWLGYRFPGVPAHLSTAALDPRPQRPRPRGRARTPHGRPARRALPRPRPRAAGAPVGGRGGNRGRDRRQRARHRGGDRRLRDRGCSSRCCRTGRSSSPPTRSRWACICADVAERSPQPAWPWLPARAWRCSRSPPRSRPG